ncbi:MAG: DDE-type integrase/transposase/recombinase, partial [Candidatus Heimdallarchaeota archaeon]
MTTHYLGQLQIEANVPDKLIVKDFINVTVDFQILCPECGPNTKKIKKNGHDIKLKGKPQVFYCHNHKIYFFPHTSWIFKEFTNLVIENVIEHLFINNLTPKAVATIASVSQSMISTIRHHCQSLIEAKIALVKAGAKEFDKLKNLPLARQSAIWWDETFFRINGVDFFLILLIDATGKVLGFKFSRTRKTEDFLSILIPIIDQLPENPIFIGDGWITYEKVCKELKMDLFLIQHIHSNPWEYAKIHQFIYDEKLNQGEQISIQIPYKSFLEEKRVEGVGIKRKYKLYEKKESRGSRGRPQGSKDKKKRRKKGESALEIDKKKLKKRGRKNLKEDGAKFTFEPFPYPNGWEAKFISQVSNDSNMIGPSMQEVNTLLSLTYEIMNGGYIQSNLIESKNN